MECATATKVQYTYMHSYEAFFSSSNIQCTEVSLMHVDMSLLQLTHMMGPVQTSMHLALDQGFAIAGSATAE